MLKQISATILSASLAFAPVALAAQEETVPSHSNVFEQAVAAGYLPLAYIGSTNPDQNSAQRRNNLNATGLNRIASNIEIRTEIRTAGHSLIDLNNPQDLNLSHYPLIYWSIGKNDAPITEEARTALQHYIDHGGILFLDLYDLPANQDLFAHLHHVTGGGLHFSTTIPSTSDHAAQRSFYLTPELYGSRNEARPFLVENEPSGRDGDSVSNVIISTHNWTAAWAGATLRTDSNEFELALRTGINLFTYSVTGNYKEDPLHIRRALDQMGEVTFSQAPDLAPIPQTYPSGHPGHGAGP